jgi:hypothetical protein
VVLLVNDEPLSIRVSPGVTRVTSIEVTIGGGINVYPSAVANTNRVLSLVTYISTAAV